MGTEVIGEHDFLEIVCRMKRHEDLGDTMKSHQHIRSHKKEPTKETEGAVE